MTDKTPGFSIIIPAWNESTLIADTVKAAISSIEQQHHSGQVIVVDNNSTDETAAIARQAGAAVVHEPINQIARARNAGASASNSQWLVFIDADTIISPELLALALNALSSGTVIGGGSTVAADRPVSQFGRRVLAFWNWVSVKSRTAAGCFIYCRHDAFVEIGGFDNKVYAGEELHLSRHLRRLAKERQMQFVIHTEAPITTSARKLDWYSPTQMIGQFLLLLLPFATHSRRFCGVWYKRKASHTKN